MAQFILKITLGNEAMITPHHIQNALYRTAKRIYDADFNMDDMKKEHTILDLNGNTVGSWMVK